MADAGVITVTVDASDFEAQMESFVKRVEQAAKPKAPEPTSIAGVVAATGMALAASPRKFSRRSLLFWRG